MSEIQAAAERLRKVREDGEYDDVYEPRATAYGIVSDCEILADAYLAEHPADDVEAIDEAWLRSVSFMQEQGFYFFRTAAEGLGRVKWLKVAPNGIAYVQCDVFAMQLNDVKTRGELRALLRALKIEMKGGA